MRLTGDPAATATRPRLAFGFGFGLGLPLDGERLAEALAARVRRALAATWLTPSAAASSRPVRSWSSASRRAARCRSGMRASALHVARQVRVHHEALGRRRGAVRLAGPREEPDDLAPADLVERDAVRDLVEPGAGVLGLLERLVVLVRLDERVLGQVRGQLGLTEHPQQVGVDLAVVLGEERLDEAPASS